MIKREKTKRHRWCARSGKRRTGARENKTREKGEREREREGEQGRGEREVKGLKGGGGGGGLKSPERTCLLSDQNTSRD